MIEVIIWIFVCIFAIIFVAAVIMLLKTTLDMCPLLREKETYKDSFSEDWDSEEDKVYDDL